MTDGTNFTAEDLALLSAEPASDAGNAAADAGNAGDTKAAGEQAAAAVKEAAASQDGAPAKIPNPKTGTLLDDEGEDGKGDAGKADGEKPEGDKPAKDEKKPEDAATDWRKDFAGKLLAKLKGTLPDDKIAAREKAILNRLARYKDAEAYMIAGFAAQERIASGEMKSKLPADASEEEIAAWRAENGVPEKAQSYDVPKIPGYKWTDADKPLIDAFKEKAFQGNMSQPQVDLAAQWYVETVQKQAQEWQENLAQTDAQDRNATREALRAEWGPQDFKPTTALIDRLLADDTILSEGLGQEILSARYTDKDGVSRRLINKQPFARMLAQYARDTYGDSSFVSGGKGSAGQLNVIEEADKIMKQDLDRYYREGWDVKALAAMEEEEKTASRRGRRAA
jgi:hypothetical protein